jgi:hypothetical protein
LKMNLSRLRASTIFVAIYDVLFLDLFLKTFLREIFETNLRSGDEHVETLKC